MRIKQFKRNGGFTLIELMIVVLVVAILAAIAYPSYQDSVRKARRADGKELLMRVAQAQERHFTRFGQYAAGLTGAPGANNLGFTADANGNLSSEGGNYNVTVNVVVAPFRLTATPVQGDPECGVLTLDNLGRKTSNGNQGNDFCW
jgi:type IV pilus assembly protein PilE